MRARRVVAGIGVGALGLAYLLVPGPAAGAADRPARSYVALGDSYTSAPLVPPAAEGAPAQCARSGGNYPNLVAKALDLRLTDVSCGGARVDELWKPQGSGIPAQFEALRKTTDVVTVGIGGNDNGLFARVIAGCSAATLRVLTGTLTPCQDTFGDSFSKDIQSDASRIRDALRHIKTRSPKARVIVVGYPALLPVEPVGQAQCLLAVVPFTPGDMAYLDKIERELNAMLAAAAKATGAVFVDTYAQSVGHDMCRLPGTRWIEPSIPLSSAAPYHPNADGQAAVAKAVFASLNRQ